MNDFATELTAKKKAADELRARLNGKAPFWTVVDGWSQRVAQVLKITEHRGARVTGTWRGSTGFEPLRKCIGVFPTAEAATTALSQIKEFDVQTKLQLTPLREELRRQDEDRAQQRREAFLSLETE